MQSDSESSYEPVHRLVWVFAVRIFNEKVIFTWRGSSKTFTLSLCLKGLTNSVYPVFENIAEKQKRQMVSDKIWSIRTKHFFIIFFH